ncbi:hypothetical protein VOLCADRAFT_94506 [Volvox carteri f. nagariensis]|uniref:SMP domain-containing protein n=1 Tax=Volvox carteri f. nagariensis TaxID=3068 RepID=D8U4Z3_VOLCA|nr:uncharacterized protein VOLCADRAFT_94506 [Volvox carteri f. nagariensis]EFJ45279.1 hypothetical protein VOLCADRAFT_94506 [Volvox carteri f. nagariensis]|eukprot:XP_002953655.1 hypothetical protein VOLCADRAFT_94506 [Volvox carteri f. nagariensis]
MTKEDAARIQSTQAREGHDVGKGSFPARAQSAADRHEAEHMQENAAAGGGGSGGRHHEMTKEDAARIQSTQAREGHDVGKGSFPARAQAAADRHEAEHHRWCGIKMCRSHSGLLQVLAVELARHHGSSFKPFGGYGVSSGSQSQKHLSLRLVLGGWQLYDIQREIIHAAKLYALLNIEPEDCLELIEPSNVYLI